MTTSSLFESDRMKLAESIQLTIDSLRAYGAKYRHWAMAFSGGKDSTALVTLVAHLIQTGRIDPPESLTVLYADTRMELTPLQVSAMGVMAELRERGIEARVVFPALDDRYIKPGYVFTSRGCPRRCWFCSVWKRRPEATPIPTLHEGWNVLDDNLLACPEWHVRRVFAMLARQGRQIEFTGGLEAAALQDYQVGLLADLRPRPNMFFAYDPGDPFETLKSAADRMIAAGFTACSHRLRTYVLIGFPKDTFAEATKRLDQMIGIGFTPHAMLWQPETPSAEKWRPAPEWDKFQRKWARPAIIHATRHGVAT